MYSSKISFISAQLRSLSNRDQHRALFRVNDLIGHAVAWLQEGDIAPHDLGSDKTVVGTRNKQIGRLRAAERSVQVTGYSVPAGCSVTDAKDLPPTSRCEESLVWLPAQKPWIVPIPGTTKLHRLDERTLGPLASKCSRGASAG